MPDVWLRYGDVEVFLEIRREVLSEIVRKSPPRLTDLSKRAREMDVEGALLLPLDMAKQTVAVLEALRNARPGEELKIGLAEGAFEFYAERLRGSGFELVRLGGPLVEVGAVDSAPVKIPRLLLEFGKVVSISTSGFDPLFGFRSGSAMLLRTLLPELVGEAVRLVRNFAPSPGIETPALQFAERVSEEVRIDFSSEVVPCGDGIVDIVTGRPRESRIRSSEILLAHYSHELRREVDAVITSPGTAEGCATLASSLSACFNLCRGLEEGADIVLFSEASSGLGSKALREWIFRTIDCRKILERGEYIEGLELLLFLEEVRKLHRLYFMTALPRTYVEAMGMVFLRSSSEALDKLVGELGRKRILVVPNAEYTLLLRPRVRGTSGAA